MMHHEFEELAGYEVSYETYNKIIEPMYMAANLPKADFIKLLNKKALALPTRQQCWNEIRSLAAHLKETYLHYTDYETRDKLETAMKEYAKRFGWNGQYIDYAEHWTCYYPEKVTFWSYGERTSLVVYLDQKKAP